MDMNSGYVGWSMSRRAGEAYDNGLAPLSKIKGGAWKKIAAKIVGPAEWHHTSKFCNRTDFYDPRAIAGAIRALKKLGRTPAEATLAPFAWRGRHSVFWDFLFFAAEPAANDLDALMRAAEAAIERDFYKPPPPDLDED